LSENSIKTVAISNIKEECDHVSTLTFKMDVENKKQVSPRPGQFVMIWVPGVDEIPISLSEYDEKGNWSITVKDVGECTHALCTLKIGDYIGVRGPLGNGFNIPQDKDLQNMIIAGGIGFAPLKPLLLELKKKEMQINLFSGAKMKEQMVFTNFCQNIQPDCDSSYFCTDDGSFGEKGLVSEIFENIIKTFSKDKLKKLRVFACGPEKMIFKIFKTCEKHDLLLQASLERVMRCGCGLCGLCVMDPIGLLVCKDGPVFSSQILRKMEDFGKNCRNFTGRKIPF